MADLVADPDVGATDLETEVEDAYGDGEVTSFEVELAGSVPTPAKDADEAAETGARFTVTLQSDAAMDPVELQGSMPLTYDPEDGRWSVEWEPQLLIPGVEDADRLAVRTRWHERGSIVDRNGRVLARRTGSYRIYPMGSVAGSTVGHLEPLTRREARQVGRKPGHLVGASGLEAAYEERLAGRPTSILRAVDSTGHTVAQLGGRNGRSGRTVRATIDIDVQRAAAAAFGPTVGGAVVMDPRNGDILAVVSSGEIDPNNYVGVEDVNPFNRALSGRYAPGSSLKVMTAAAALDTGEFTPNSKLTGPSEYRGVRNFESGSFGTIDFATALKHSVNTAFAQVAEELGGGRLMKYARAFGFNRSPAMPLAAADSSFPPPADEGDLLWGAIGQAQVVATPVHMASIAATVANGGIRVEPRSSTHDERSATRVVGKRTANDLTEMMIGVVEGGTGTAARISGLDVAGKTGTAEVLVDGEIMNHAWFICFAPASDPEVAVAVVSELGGIGGRVAAPLARSILASVLPLI